MLKSLFISLFVCLLTLTFAQTNTILIIADDLGSDYFGFYENDGDTVDVPNIRRLMQAGVKFTNMMSNPVCSATRSSILTGRYGFRTGVGGIVGGEGGSKAIDTAEMSIPKMLHIFNPSIAKASIGKWHLNQPSPSSNLKSPLALGYNHFEGPFTGQITNYNNWTKYTNGVQSTVTNYATSENVNNAINWLKQVNPNKPFFLWLAFNAPHSPFHLPPASLHQFNNLSGTAADIQSKPKMYFKAMIQAMDKEIGRLCDSLRALDKFENTNIIFIGDNGNTPSTSKIPATNNSKGTIYQYGISVPCIIAGPIVKNPDRSSNALVNAADLFATIIESFGFDSWKTSVPNNVTIDSKSLLPILKNTSDSIRTWTFSEIFKLTTDANDGKTIRNRHYKLMKFDNGKQKLFNLSNDPLETKDLLTEKLSDTDIANYYFLCNELTKLLGINSFCQTLVSSSGSLQSKKLLAFPNPFNQFIYIEKDFDSKPLLILKNSLGQLIYQGYDIENQYFGDIPPGLYYLYSSNNSVFPIKMIKI